MNWYRLSLISGLALFLIGIVVLLLGERIAAALLFAVGAAFLAFDLTPATKGEFTDITREVLVKKLLGILLLVAATVLFVLHLGYTRAWF
jgi:hypothetical protein